MKKFLYFVAAATFCFIACQKEVDLTESAKTNNGDTFTFKASIEQLANPTKGTIDTDNGLVWATGDQIGIYVDDAGWTDKNQPFTLSSGAGTTEGEFTWDHTGTFSDKAIAAFYPWSAESTNNYYDAGVIKFKLHESYYSYASGKMQTPLVASLANSSDYIHFKHAGAAVKVTINNVPARVHSIGMSVDGQQITGNYSVNPANAGTDALTRVGEANTTKNTVWLNLWNGGESKWDFIFPVPELTKPKLSFQMWDENDILVWSKSSKALASDLGRGDILVMPELTITPYKQFSVSSDWTFCGTINGSAWVDDIPMYTDGTVCILRGITFKEGDIFKIRKNKNWDDEVYPGKQENETWNVTNDNKGTKDVWFNTSTHEITLKDAKCPYPAPKVTLYFGINSELSNTIHISSSTLAPGEEWPGLELTEREYFNGKWYYKHVVDGPTVWGKTVSAYIVCKDKWNTNNSNLSFTTIKTEYYFEATKSTDIAQVSERPGPTTTGITINGDMTDWLNVIPLESASTSMFRSWKFYKDTDNLYFHFVLRKNEMYNGKNLLIGFDFDDSGSYQDWNQMTGCEILISFQPFTNSAKGTPTIATSITTATINGTDGQTVSISAGGYDPDSTATDNDANYYLEVKIPRNNLPNTLPAAGSNVNIAASYNYYTTGFSSVTL